MGQSITPIEVLDSAVVEERVASGLIVPMHSGPDLRVVDCGDDRPLTPEYYEQRTAAHGFEVYPGRYYGAASGIAVAAMIGFAAEHGDEAVTRFIRDFSPEGFVDFAANLSDRALRLPTGSIELNQHSDDGKERNRVALGDHKECGDPLGCAFATKLGRVLLGANGQWQVQEAHNVLSAAGADLPLDDAQEGIIIMQRHIPEDFGIHRGAIHHSQTKKGKFTPVAIHEGHHAPNDVVKLTIDLAGYRSNANLHSQTGLWRYHHTPGLASEVLDTLMPEIKLDPRILEATGLLLGTSTRLALSGPETPDELAIEVIPAEYAQAA